jgi:tRNA(Ile)-lysidine synthase
MTRAAEPADRQVWPPELLAAVSSLPDHSRLVIALSGGLDSVVLLNLAVAVYGSALVEAVHINHQLQAHAEDMEALCRRLCDRLGVRLLVHRLEWESGLPRSGIEEQARERRYEFFRQILNPGDLLLMAHHGDDQAETVLFRMLRGSGVRGLAGIPGHRALGAGQIGRPLLPFNRSLLERHAKENWLEWSEDPSNQSDHFDRNFLRLRVMPLLRERWPSLDRRLGHTAQACRESALLADRLADIQLESLQDGAGCLALPQLKQLELAEQKNVLRRWVEHRGFRLPSVADWAGVISQFVSAGEDREPALPGDGYCLCRYRSRLYLVPDVPVVADDQELVPGNTLGRNGWQLRLEPVTNQNTACPSIRVTARCGGERFRPVPGGPSRPLSKWLQEKAVPPWERQRIPLVYLGSGQDAELLAVGDLWQSPAFSGSAPDSGWRIVIEKDSN